uniref:Putative salivary lipocalin n=1 Tax=Ixodes ricinus TaxID=34613 RepID=A0A0K8R7W3_IXORI
MKIFFSLMLAALCTFVKCAAKCNCPALERYLLDEAEYNRFRNPWPCLKSAERFYLKYMPYWKHLKIECITSDLIKNDTAESVERKVSWTDRSKTQPSRTNIDIQIRKHYGRSPGTEFTVLVFKEFGFYEFDTVYAGSRCLIVTFTPTKREVTKGCFFWVKETALKSPLRHCYFLYYMFCPRRDVELYPYEGCYKKVESEDENLQSAGNNQPPAPSYFPR